MPTPPRSFKIAVNATTMRPPTDPEWRLMEKPAATGLAGCMALRVLE